VNKTWAYGLTTVPERFGDLLPRTLISLSHAGFGMPHLFVDDGNTRTANIYRDRFGLQCSVRDGRIGPFGNWVRFPSASHFAIFQDDLLAAKNLRTYLDHCQFPDRGYWNLFTFLDSDRVVVRPGWVEGPTLNMASDPKETLQSGRGALALMFSRDGVLTLLSSPDFVRKPVSTDQPRTRIDGAVVNAMNKAGYREWVHGPSLVYHTGINTSVLEPGKAGKVWQNNARTWQGEGWDAAAEMPKLLKGGGG
jgi:hypothetical protein